MNDAVCQHDINIEPNTMRFYRRRFMVVPDYMYAVCTVCNKQVIYIKNESGYSIAKEGNGDED
jgi:hypothetical protein